MLSQRKNQHYSSAILIAVIWITNAVNAHATTDTSRPKVDSKPTEVRVMIAVIDVDEINDAAQSFTANVYIEAHWHDYRLVRKDGEKIKRPISEVWHPRLQIVNRQKLFETFEDMVEINPNGHVVYRQRYWGSFSQPLKLHEFPLDRQKFEILLVSSDYNSEEVRLIFDPSQKSGLAPQFSVSDWKIENSRFTETSFTTISGVKKKTGLSVSFEGTRRFEYYAVQVIFPLCLIVAMSWIVFWIDPEQAGTQISVSVTTMLTLIAYRFMVGAVLPKMSYLTRMDKFILMSTILVFLTLFQAVITSNLAKSERNKLADRYDRWCRWIFPSCFGLIYLFSFVF